MSHDVQLDADVATPTPTPTATLPPDLTDLTDTAAGDARLWDALTAPPDPVRPDPPATVTWCRRCGYGNHFGCWTPRSPHPVACPFCHSAYWDRPGVRRFARQPAITSIAAMEAELRRQRTRDARRRKHYRHVAQLKRLAGELGVKVVRRRRRASVAATTATTATTATQPSSASASAPTPSTQQPVAPRAASGPAMPPAAFRRTVPPPPGLDDLGGTTP